MSTATFVKHPQGRPEKRLNQLSFLCAITRENLRKPNVLATFSDGERGLCRGRFPSSSPTRIQHELQKGRVVTNSHKERRFARNAVLFRANTFLH